MNDDEPIIPILSRKTRRFIRWVVMWINLGLLIFTQKMRNRIIRNCVSDYDDLILKIIAFITFLINIYLVYDIYALIYTIKHPQQDDDEDK